MATINTRQYMRPRTGRSGFDLLHASDTPEDAARLAAEGYKPADPDTARAAVTYNSKGWAQGEDAYRLGLKERPVEVSLGEPRIFSRIGQPMAEDWGDGKRGGMTGATGRELDAAGMLGTGPDVEVREGAPSLVSRTPARDEDWGDAKRSGMSNPRAAGAPGLQVSPSSRSAGDADYLQRLQKGVGAAGAPPAAAPFSDDELQAMFMGGEAAADDSDPALAAAQDAARERRLVSEIGRAGAQFNESLTGAKYDRAAYDGYARDAERPVGDLLQRREAVAQRQGRERTAQQDRLRAEEAARGYRRQQTQDARQASNDAYQRERDARGDARQQARDAEEARRFNLSRQDAAANRALQRQAQGDSKALANQQRMDAARAKADAQAQENALKRGEKLGQATTKAPYGELQTALKALDDLSPGLIYGQAPDENPMSVKDRIANGAPFGSGDWAISDKGLDYKQNLQNLRDLITRLRSGAAINESEERHYLSLLGDNILSDPRRAAAGINAVRQGIAQKLRDAQLAYSGPTLDAYEQGGGTTFRNPVFSGQAPQRAPAAASVVMVSPDGRQYTVDPSEVEEAQQNGWRRK